MDAEMGDSEEVLPRGWERFFSEKKGQHYFFNRATGEAMWEHPCDHDDKTVDEKVDLLLQGRKVYNHFCVDTNVFLHDLWFVEYLVDRPRSWVYIPYYVLNELDHQTKGRTPEHTDEVKKAARRATKQIDEWLKERKVMSESVDKSIANLARGFNNDDKILRSCLSKGPGAFLISNDRNLQARAHASNCRCSTANVDDFYAELKRCVDSDIQKQGAKEVSVEECRKIENEKRKKSKFERQRSLEESIDDRVSLTPSPPAETHNNNGMRSRPLADISQPNPENAPRPLVTEPVPKVQTNKVTTFDDCTNLANMSITNTGDDVVDRPVNVTNKMSDISVNSSKNFDVRQGRANRESPTSFAPRMVSPNPIGHDTNPFSTSHFSPNLPSPFNPFSSCQSDIRQPVHNPAPKVGVQQAYQPPIRSFQGCQMGGTRVDARPSPRFVPPTTNFDKLYIPREAKNSKVMINQDEIENLIEPTKLLLIELFVTELEGAFGPNALKEHIQPRFRIMLKNGNISIIQILTLWIEKWSTVFGIIQGCSHDTKKNCEEMIKIMRNGPDEVMKGDWLFIIRNILSVFRSRNVRCADFYTKIVSVIDPNT